LIENKDIHPYYKNEYGQPDIKLREKLCSEFGNGFRLFVGQFLEYGICKIPNVISNQALENIRADLAVWEGMKNWDQDNHMGFDGNSRERYLPTSIALSRAVAHPAILNFVTTCMGQHPKMNFIRTTFLNPIETYERRAFQWHHDGYGKKGLRVMLLLTDVPEHGQAMKYCPATNVFDWPTRSSRETRFTNEYTNHFEQYICSGKAGDAIVFTNHGLHRGQRNNSVRRDTVLINFQPGVARSYPLPGFAASVAEHFSEYEKKVFGLTGFIESARIPDDEFQKQNEQWLEEMRNLYQSYTPPVQEIRHLFTEEKLDKTISEKGTINVSVKPLIQPFADFEAYSQLEAFREKTLQALLDLKSNLSTFSSFNQALGERSAQLKGIVLKDLHGDLDLPIRIYHPSKDQARDNAITQTRDGKSEAISQLIERLLTELDYQSFIGENVQGFSQIADSLLEMRDIIRNLVHDNTEVSPSSILSLLEDLSEMIKRAYNNDLLRRTVLYTFLMAHTLQLHFQQNKPSTENINKLEHLTNKALISYGKLLLVS
jgi:hypothetical protein